MDVMAWEKYGCDFALTLRGKNVTQALRPMVSRLQYLDNVVGEADTLDIELEDVDGRFRGPWYPNKGDLIVPQFGRTDLPLLTPGEFEIDQISFSGPPSTCTIRALSAGVQKAVRTQQGRAFENKTLAEIVGFIAQKQHLKVVGKVANVMIDRVTQFKETDLAFLTRLGGQYGYTFKINGKNLVFMSQATLAAGKAVATITMNDVAFYRFTDQIKDVPRKVTQRAYDDDARSSIEEDAENVTTNKTAGAKSSVDTSLVLIRRGTPGMSAARKAAAQDTLNDTRLSASLTLTRGSQQLCAGLVVQLAGFDRLGGLFLIDRAVHTISRQDGYVTAIEMKKVQDERA